MPIRRNGSSTLTSGRGGVCEHEEQLDDQWLTSMMVNQLRESRGPVRGMQIWLELPEKELLTLEIKKSTYLHDVIVEASKISTSITPTSDVYITRGKKIIDPGATLCAQEVVEGSILAQVAQGSKASAQRQVVVALP